MSDREGDSDMDVNTKDYLRELEVVSRQQRRLTDLRTHVVERMFQLVAALEASEWESMSLWRQREIKGRIAELQTIADLLGIE